MSPPCVTRLRASTSLCARGRRPRCGLADKPRRGSPWTASSPAWHCEITGGSRTSREPLKESRMNRILRDERGMALAVAIFALVVVGALVAGAFFAGTQEQRVGENQRRVQTSFGIAEAGAQERVLVWDPATMNRIKQYPESSVAIANQPAPGGTGRYSGTTYRLGPNIFLLDITGQD